MGVGPSKKPRNDTGKSVLRQKLETAKKTGVLSLSEHKLEQLPDAVWEISKLRTLDVSKNKLSSLPSSGVSQVTELKSLNAESNLLAADAWLRGMSSLSKLQTLNLSHNSLRSSQFPSRLSLPSSLKVVKLAYNALGSIPVCLYALPHLERLDLSGNDLTTVVPPSSFGDDWTASWSRSLREWILDDNPMTSLPPEVGKLRALTSLSLKRNALQGTRVVVYSPPENPQPLPAELFRDTALIDFNLHENPMTNTVLNTFDGFDAFLQRRAKAKSKDLQYGVVGGGDVSVCGLE